LIIKITIDFVKVKTLVPYRIQLMCLYDINSESYTYSMFPDNSNLRGPKKIVTVNECLSHRDI